VVELLSLQPHLKRRVQSGDDSDSVSGEEGQENALTHQVLGTMHVGFPPRVKKLPTLAKSPYRLPCRQLIAKEVFTLCLRDWILTALAYNRGFKTTPWIGEWVSLGAFKK
jgi:hypothetical protein